MDGQITNSFIPITIIPIIPFFIIGWDPICTFGSESLVNHVTGRIAYISQMAIRPVPDE